MRGLPGTELGSTYGSLVVVAAETGLRTTEWAALERRDIDRVGRAVTVQRRFACVLSPFRKRNAHARRVPLTARALEPLPPRLDVVLLFPAPEGGSLSLDNWRNREWYRDVADGDRLDLWTPCAATPRTDPGSPRGEARRSGVDLAHDAGSSPDA